MSSIKKANPWRIKAIGVPKETLKALPLFKNPAEAVLSNRELRAPIASSDQTFNGIAMVDWRSTGAIPIPRSQQACNTCTSFAVVSVIESLHFIKNHTRIQLSPGFIHSCLLNLECNMGAGGKDVLDHVKARGVAYSFQNDYPFPKDHCNTGDLYRITGVVRLDDPSAAMQAIANHGPIIGSMEIGPEFLKVGPETIYQYRQFPTPLLHSVAIVGYDRNQGFWIVANSYGEKWGENGFGRVAFGSGGLLSGYSGWQILL